ncbi:MAG TPA: HNH endonuclease signature motif containing protein [Blastocatellia bacterium]|nr:HNH endonuclease signature motif containing protein [Blastocatellia bacterium]
MDKRKISGRIRRAVEKRARRCCEYCWSQLDFATEFFSAEHVVPRSKGGANRLSNLALSCQLCNGYKHDKVTGTDPVSGKQAPLFNPRKQNWHEHFGWSEDFLTIYGLTATGRATVETLQLNHKQRVNLRRVLCASSEHPPEHFFTR